MFEKSDIALFLWRLTFKLAVIEASKPIIAVIDTAITPTANITSTSVKAFFCFKFGFIFYLLITSSISSYPENAIVCPSLRTTNPICRAGLSTVNMPALF